MQIRLKPLLTGIASWAPFLYGIASPGPNPAPPLYCYAAWIKHLSMARQAGMKKTPENVAELGPGHSLGVGLAALLTGARRYVGLDVVPFTAWNKNTGMLDALVRLFRDRTPVPSPDSFPNLRRFLDESGAPLALRDDALDALLAPTRIEAIRKAFECARLGRPSTSEFTIEYRVPWEREAASLRGTMDLVMSHAVMQHVPDVAATYARIARILRPGGITTHQIHFGSHGITRDWNGHWAEPDWRWRIALGRKPFLINRQPLSAHRRALRAAGLTEALVETLPRASAIERSALAAHWRELSDDDLGTEGAFLVGRADMER